MFTYVFLRQKALINYSRLGADCQQRQNQVKNDVQVTYEIGDKGRLLDHTKSVSEISGFRKDLRLHKPLVKGA